MSKMMERVAGVLVDWLAGEWDTVEAHRECAKRVIAAMREPTADMIWDGGKFFNSEARGSLASDDAVECWQAMIDAALE